MPLALRDGVVGADVDAACRPALHAQQQPVVLLRAGVGEVVEESDELPDRRVRLRNLASQIECRRAGGAVGERLRAGQGVQRARPGRRRTRWNGAGITRDEDRKSTRLNSSHGYISYAVFCLKKKKK